MASSVIRDSFSDSVSKHFNSMNQTQLTDAEIDSFVDYLIDCKIIPDVTMRIYTVLAEAKKIIAEHPGKNKSECVDLLTAKLNLNSSTIWNILKDHKDKFNFG